MGDRSAFPRVSGGIVLDSFSIVSLFTGLLAILPAGFLLFVGGWGPRSEGIGSAASVVWGLTVLVCVSRFGQLGLAGDSDGGLFSELAGPWSGTFLVAARLLVLWAAWLSPIVLWAVLRGSETGTGVVPMAGPFPIVPRIPILLALWTALALVLAFAFIAIATAAPGFGDLFSPGLWRAVLGGRLGELFVAIAGTFGPPLAVLVFVLPLLGTIAPARPKLALAALAPIAVYLVGMVLTLQGKLAGAFAAGGIAGEALEIPAEEEAPAASAPAAAAPSAAPVAPAAAAPAPRARPAAAPAPAAAPPAGDPRQLHDAWRVRFAAGEAEAALAAAKEAIPAGIAWGNARIAAEIYRFHLDRLADLGLDHAALDALADQLLRDGDVAAAAWTFSQVLDADPADVKAFKGLLRVADHHLEKAKAPFEAVRVYRYLLERAPASPFADHARGLLADAERKAARPQAPQG
jgi:hypothetical protein